MRTDIKVERSSPTTNFLITKAFRGGSQSCRATIRWSSS
jgi:hypothetical protein